MRWQIDSSGDSTARVDAGSSVHEAMKGFCLHLERDVLPRNKDIDWDHLRFDICADAGRIIVYPAATRTIYRIETADCLVIFDKLASRFQEIADLALDDKELDRQIEAEERVWFYAFLDAARNTRLRGLRVLFTHVDDEKVIEDVLVW